MRVEILQETLTSLPAYAAIPVSFVVESFLDVIAVNDGAAYELLQRAVVCPYTKDYDALDGGPLRWPSRFKLSSWALWAAYVDGLRVGGAAVAFDTPEFTDGRDDLAVLWDLRVAPAARGRGVGSVLFRAAEERAAARGCRELMVETQNVNVPACRFYARNGCALRAAHPSAYPTLPAEVQLLWYKQIPV